MQIVNVGMIGCGMVAQWMHLPFLTELPGYRVTAVCDISAKVAAFAAQRFHVEQQYTDYQKMLEQAPLDAVVIGTPLQSDIAIAAARAGKHVLVEKPMALNLADAEAMVEAAESAGVTLMVGYMKRYDPGYLYGQNLMQSMPDLHLIHVHDLCGPNEAFLGDLTTTFRDRGAEERTGPSLLTEKRHKIEQAIGTGHPEAVYQAYDLLGGLASHDISILRGAFGSPTRVLNTEIWHKSTYILSTFDQGNECRTVFEIGLTRKKEFDEVLTAFGESSTVRIRFPSPFIKYAPTIVEQTVQEGNALIQRTVTASYEEAFRSELEHFYACVVRGQQPRTPGREGLEDVRLQIDILKAALR